eukprot:1013313-Amphidinium_carterae.1
MHVVWLNPKDCEETLLAFTPDLSPNGSPQMKRWLLASLLWKARQHRLRIKGQRNLPPTVTRMSTTAMLSKNLRKMLVKPAAAVTIQGVARSRRMIR